MYKTILSLIFGAFLLMSNVGAQEPYYNPPYSGEPAPDVGPQLWWMQMPVICGSVASVDAYLKKYEFELINVSIGRRQAQPDGEPVYVVSYWMTKDKKQSIAVVTSMSGLESCMMYKSFDLTFDVLPGEKT